MALTIGIRANTLVGGKRSLRFHTMHQKIIDCNELIAIMSAARTTVSKPDIAAVVTLLTETISSLVSDGNFVKTPLGDFYLTAVGTADSEGEPFIPNRPANGQGFRLRFRPDRSAEKAMIRSVTVNRDDEAGKRLPCISRFIPLRANNVDKTTELDTVGGDGVVRVDQGCICRLKGRTLSFDPGDYRCGVFFLPSRGRIVGDTGIRCDFYISIKPGSIILQLPPGIEPGLYNLELRSVTKAGTLRTGAMQQTIRVG
ncbi:MAG: DNA-binding domain-containing protein [Clostridia bacterium]